MSDLDTLNQTLTAYTADHDAKIAQLNSSRDAANTATANAIAAVSTDQRVRIYLDPVNGDDTNDGLVLARAVKTWAGAWAKARAGQAFEIYAYGVINVDTSIDLRGAPYSVTLRGFTSDAKFVLKDDPNQATRPGGIYAQGSIVLSVIDVDIELDNHKPNVSPITVVGDLLVSSNNFTITRTAAATGAPLFNSKSGHLEVVNTVIDSTASGHVIAGVPAAGDPNALPGLSANFTTN